MKGISEMLENDIIVDAFERIKQSVHRTVENLSVEQLTHRPSSSANSIDWLVWHLTRIQDDHIASAADTDQVWESGWYEKFDLDFDKAETGYGHSSDEVGSVKADADLLLGYYDAVHETTLKYLKSLKTDDYKRIVDANWNPPVTLAVRLISVISDDLQHAGQAAYAKGLL
jgi:uncharacterized damage-inducible protein DinB